MFSDVFKEYRKSTSACNGLSSQSCMYSYYKSHVTYKGLLGIAPSGGISIISQLYDGSMSDKEIV